MRIGKILKTAACLVLALLVLLPAEAEAKKKKAATVGNKMICRQPIEQIVNQTAYDVKVFPGDECMIEVIGPEEALDHTSVVLSNGVLKIGYLSDIVYDNLTFNVTSNDVNSVIVKGSGSISAESMDSGFVSIGLYGSGSVSVGQLTATKTQALLKGSGDILIGKATVSYADLTLQGSGDIVVRNMDSTSLDCMLKGSGDINVHNVKSSAVKAHCLGSGDIYVSGNTNVSSLLNLGSGDIHASKLKSVRSTKVNKGTGDIDD